MPAIIIIIMLIELLNNNGILLNIAVCASAVLSANTVPLGPYNCLVTSSFSFLVHPRASLCALLMSYAQG